MRIDSNYRHFLNKFARDPVFYLNSLASIQSVSKHSEMLYNVRWRRLPLIRFTSIIIYARGEPYNRYICLSVLEGRD